MEPKKETKQGSKHILIMVLCCLAPMLLVVLLFTVGIGGILPFLVILMCPLMHFILMRGMHGKHDHNEHSDHYIINTETNAKQLKQVDNTIEPAKLADAEPDMTDRQEVERG